MFEICNNKGFLVTFPNGITLSTQFGGGDFCMNFDDPVENYTEGKQSVDAEIAVVDKEGNWRTREVMTLSGEIEPLDNVVGHVTVDLWCRVVDACRKLAADASDSGKQNAGK